jgi:hypothetical protein
LSEQGDANSSKKNIVHVRQHFEVSQKEELPCNKQLMNFPKNMSSDELSKVPIKFTHFSEVMK